MSSFAICAIDRFYDYSPYYFHNPIATPYTADSGALTELDAHFGTANKLEEST